MAKTIMISNDLYKELKIVKRDRSFSEVIKGLIEAKKRKTGSGLRECLGLLDKNDSEYERALKELRPLYKKWTKRYA